MSNELEGTVDLATLKAVVEQAEQTDGKVQVVIGLDAPTSGSIRCVPGDTQYPVGVDFDLHSPDD